MNMSDDITLPREVVEQTLQTLKNSALWSRAYHGSREVGAAIHALETALAEPSDDIVGLRQEIERLREENERLREQNERFAALICEYAAEEAPDALRQVVADRDALEAEVEQLREALQDIEDYACEGLRWSARGTH